MQPSSACSPSASFSITNPPPSSMRRLRPIGPWPFNRTSIDDGMNSMHSRQVLQLLEQFESRNVTAIEPDGSWPMVWERAQGVHVWDAEGKKYLDLTAA